MKRPVVLFIAGFDPSAGAGVLADVKTAEQIGCYGLAACSTVTYQSDQEFTGLTWLRLDQVIQQLRPLFKRFSISVVKIGLIKDASFLLRLIKELRELQPSIKIVWDPVLKSSTGFQFHERELAACIEDIVSEVFLLTPNVQELLLLTGTKSPEVAGRELSQHCKVLLTGNRSAATVVDTLYDQEKEVNFSSPWIACGEKHGSGCVLSSALSSYLARGEVLEEAVLSARSYTRKFLLSSEDLIGYHAELVAA